MKPTTEIPAITPQLACRHRFPALADATEHGIRVFADNSSRAQMPDMTLAAVADQLKNWETHKGGQPLFDSPRAARGAELREHARAVAASFCGGHPGHIGFAANGTSTLAILSRAMF